MPGDLYTALRIISLSPLSLATDVTDATIEASGLWLETRTGAGGTTTLARSFFSRSPWLNGQRVLKSDVKIIRNSRDCDLVIIKMF